jgi:NADH dehydrogenase
LGRICILGGTGFVGRHIVEQLAKQGHHVRVLSRHRERHRELLVLPTVEVVNADIHELKTLKDHFTGQDAVINLVGILNEDKQRSFQNVHVALARKVVDACQTSKVKRLLHMSALNADAGRGTSRYLRSKGEAENIAHTVKDLSVTSFQPSVIFGPEDQFYNRFADLLRLTPRFLPFPLACAGTRFAPVYVQDVATAFVLALNDKDTIGKRYPLCGPHVYTLKDIVQYTAKLIEAKCPVWPLGKTLSRLQASMLGLMPGKPFTLDNFLSLQVDSVCQQDFAGVFHIQPSSVESIVPTYLAAKTLRGRFMHYRQAARRQ